jgi:cytoskeletal protein CcmA (bactofilin family)
MAKARTGGGGEAVIGSSTRVRGRVFGDGDLRVEGSVEGDISIQGDLVVGSGARAQSNVEARAVTVLGELDGEVRAQGLVHIEAGARVHGDVHGESVALDDGAEFNGRLHATFELPAELGGSASGGRRR